MVDVESHAKSDKKPHFWWRALISAFAGNRITYLMAGAMTAVVYYCLLGLALLAAEDAVPYLVLVVTSHFVTVVIVYPWYRLVVFRVSGESWLRGYLRFYVVGLSFLGASLISLPILVGIIGIPIMIAQGLIIVISPPLSYLIHRTWTFRDRGTI
ncbi:GtrA family protein [Nonomuraea sp. NEAU-A123]|uniref:GtrA family protein n=1 Tax=Nonomuraea sp. NEAU-A123 TaxID=2839649 RepID=UPI001BE4DED1|nr:GtrA family protein [Nonomuraea sp. NEAU-A123]MBT2231293.1 GtrA family protein [Nonomuraea sp. NEAU-A123]